MIKIKNKLYFDCGEIDKLIDFEVYWSQIPTITRTLIDCDGPLDVKYVGKEALISTLEEHKTNPYAIDLLNFIQKKRRKAK